jgi:hypothetical protein
MPPRRLRADRTLRGGVVRLDGWFSRARRDRDPICLGPVTTVRNPLLCPGAARRSVSALTIPTKVREVETCIFLARTSRSRKGPVLAAVYCDAAWTSAGRFHGEIFVATSALEGACSCGHARSSLQSLRIPPATSNRPECRILPWHSIIHRL